MTLITNVTVQPFLVSFNWTDQLDNTKRGRDVITYYEVSYKPSLTDNWEVRTIEAEGKKLSFEHSVATVFPAGVTIYYKVCAKNGVGIGACTADLAVLTDSMPTRMNEPVVTVDNITPFWIRLNWLEITSDDDTGRDPIVYYGLEWD